MTVLGCSVRGDVLRAAVVEADASGAAVHAFLERQVVAGDVAGALRELVPHAGTKDVAFALAPPDVAIVRLGAATDLRPGELGRAARLRVEAAGFERGEPVHLLEGRSGLRYVGAARRAAVTELANVCRTAGARLAFVDHEGYAWGAVMGSRAQALVLVQDDGVRLVVAGGEQVQLGLFSWQGDGYAAGSDAIAAAIADAFVEAAKTGFADVDLVLADDPQERIVAPLRARLTAATIVPFALDVDPARTPWSLACGIGLRAVGRGGRRVKCNFARGGSRLATVGEGLRSSVSPTDIATIGLGVVTALALVAWRAESLRELTGRSTTLARQLAGVQSQNAGLDRTLRTLSVARGIVTAVDAARESGPLAARDVAAIVARLRADLSLTSLTGDANGWSLVGHARSYAGVAELVEVMASSGYRPSVGSLSDTDGRISYTITLRRAPAR